MNRIFLIGNLTHDTEMRSTPSGVPVCKFSIAVNRRFRNAKTGQQETDFFDIVAWRQLAELCSKYLSKGKKVAVIGSVNHRQYEGRDGTKRTAWDVIADEVQFLSQAEERTAATPSSESGNYHIPEGFTSVETDELPF